MGDISVFSQLRASQMPVSPGFSLGWFIFSRDRSFNFSCTSRLLGLTVWCPSSSSSLPPPLCLKSQSLLASALPPPKNKLLILCGGGGGLIMCAMGYNCSSDRLSPELPILSFPPHPCLHWSPVPLFLSCSRVLWVPALWELSALLAFLCHFSIFTNPSILQNDICLSVSCSLLLKKEKEVKMALLSWN